jgi:hypothetical protein
MKSIEERVKLVSPDEMGWNWESSTPLYNTKTPNSKWGAQDKFDPFPCYTHDKSYIIERMQLAEKAFGIGMEVHTFIFPYEEIGRTNGQATYNTIRYAQEEGGDGKAAWDGVIKLYGKRIPIMPAMSRYLAAHEYGHIVDYWICRERKLDHNGFDAEYAKMRGLDDNQKYGGGKWHTNTGEIIANDFRIAVCAVEPEFWPHPCKHPYDDKNVVAWWAGAKAKYAV